jgi:hypothetical protein
MVVRGLYEENKYMWAILFRRFCHTDEEARDICAVAAATGEGLGVDAEGARDDRACNICINVGCIPSKALLHSSHGTTTEWWRG